MVIFKKEKKLKIKKESNRPIILKVLELSMLWAEARRNIELAIKKNNLDLNKIEEFENTIIKYGDYVTENKEILIQEERNPKVVTEHLIRELDWCMAQYKIYGVKKKIKQDWDKLSNINENEK